MNLSQFTNKQNIALLWDVLLDELKINSTNKKLINNVRIVFESNINHFTARVNPKSNIMELNKHFLSQVVLAVNRLFPNLQQEQKIKSIFISNEEVQEPYKIEDIHASRQTEYEKEVEIKRMEMENYMTPQKPQELDFSDRNYDDKIKAMDSLVADKMSQRNMEIEQFQNYNSTSTIDQEKWLTPKETSVKNDPQIIEKTIIKNNQNSRLKHISIDSNNNITLSTLIDETDKKIKKVSWDDNYEKESTINMFKKLKKHPIVEATKNDNADEKQYIEQKSMQLPDIKQEEIIRNKITLPTPNNEPIIPKTEIIKQLNKMNTKIDNLYEMILKLTKIIEIMNSESKNNLEE